MRIEGSKDAFTMPALKTFSGGKGESVTNKKSSVDKILTEGAKMMQVREAKREMALEDVFRQAEDANVQLKAYDRRLEFSVHDETHKIMVKVIDTIDDSVIREIPSEKALDMLAYVWKMTGILVDEKR